MAVIIAYSTDYGMRHMRVSVLSW